MEQEYVIGVANKFAAFIDDTEDPYEIIRNVEAEKLRKKSLKVQVNSDNKENKVKSATPKAKVTTRKPVSKPNDRVLTAEKIDKIESISDNIKNRRKIEEPSSQGDSGKVNNYRDGPKSDGPPQRGPRNDFGKGDKRDGQRFFRSEGNRGPRTDNEQRPMRQTGDDARPPRRERGPSEFESDVRQDKRPAGRGRGNRTGFPRASDNRGKRDFDRRSGSDRTGVKPIDKKDGAGSYNWDSNKETEAISISEANIGQHENQPDWQDTEKEGSPPPSQIIDEAVENDETPPAGEEPEEITLDEYRKRRGQRERPHFDIRKPGEGEDLSQWQGMIEIKKKDENTDTEDDAEIFEFPQRAGRQRHVVGIDITFSDSFRNNRGRGRVFGGGRGKGRGEGRIYRDRPSAPKVDDEKAFPSLG